MSVWPFGIPPIALATSACLLAYWLVRHRGYHPVLVWLLTIPVASLFILGSSVLSREGAHSFADMFHAGGICGTLCGALARWEARQVKHS
jgi:hypothetical protein